MNFMSWDNHMFVNKAQSYFTNIGPIQNTNFLWNSSNFQNFIDDLLSLKN